MRIRTWRPSSPCGLIATLARTGITSVALTLALSQTIVSQQPQGQPTTAETNADGPVTVPMELVANRPIVRAKFGAQGPFALLVAPEAATSVIDHTVLPPLKHEKSEVPRPMDVDVVLGATTVRIGLGDLAQALPHFIPGPRPRGILSASNWPNRLLTLDYPRWQFVVHSGSLPEPNGLDVFALTPAASDVGVALIVANRTIPCKVDPTFAGGFLIPEATVKLLPAVGRITQVGSMTMTDGSKVLYEVQLAVDAMVGGFEFQKPSVQLGPATDVCRIGGQILMKFSVTYDLANARIRLARRPV